MVLKYFFDGWWFEVRACVRQNSVISILLYNKSILPHSFCDAVKAVGAAICWIAIVLAVSKIVLFQLPLTKTSMDPFVIFISSGSDSTTFMCRIVVHVGLCPQAAHWITMSCVVLSTSVLQLLVTNIWLNLSNTPLDCILRTQESKKTAPSLEVYSGELLSEVQPYYTRTE